MNDATRILQHLLDMGGGFRGTAEELAADMKIEALFVASRLLGGQPATTVLEPGDATRYVVIFIPTAHSAMATATGCEYLVVMPDKNWSMPWYGGYTHPEYLAEKGLTNAVTQHQIAALLTTVGDVLAGA